MYSKITRRRDIQFPNLQICIGVCMYLRVLCRTMFNTLRILLVDTNANPRNGFALWINFVYTVDSSVENRREREGEREKEENKRKHVRVCIETNS